MLLSSNYYPPDQFESSVFYFSTLIAFNKKVEESSTVSAAHAHEYSNIKEKMTLPK